MFKGREMKYLQNCPVFGIVDDIFIIGFKMMTQTMTQHYAE